VGADDGDDDGAQGGPPNIMFVTSTTQVVGSLGGLLGADDVCAQRALAARLPGTYVAYLSTTSVDARDRLAGSRGWVRTDGLPFVDTVEDLIAGRLWYPPRLDEGGIELTSAPVSAQPIVTGTTATGTIENSGSLTTCSDWTAPTTGVNAVGGSAHATGSSWTRSIAIDCAQAARLYCFGVGAQVAVAPVLVTGRLAFLSSPWIPGGGRGDADAHCQTDGAALGRTFLALLPVLGSAAVARFDTGGAPWVRVDGVPIVATASDLPISRLAAPLNRLPDGSAIVATGFPRTWTGEASPAAVPATAPCQDWVSSMLTESTGCGEENFATADFFTGCGAACSTMQRLYCLEP